MVITMKSNKKTKLDKNDKETDWTRRVRFTIKAEQWNKRVTLATTVDGRTYEERLPNWYRIDIGLEDKDYFTWGYHGTGPTCTAYSILRELFGKDIAEESTEMLLNVCIAPAAQGSGFALDGDYICHLIGVSKEAMRILNQERIQKLAPKRRD
jgi:hypothetical protein